MKKLTENKEKVGLYWEFLTIIHNLDKDHIKKYHAERKNLYKEDNNEKADIKIIFELMDKDKNGEISKEEIIDYFINGPQELKNYKIIEHIDWTIKKLENELGELKKETKRKETKEKETKETKGKETTGGNLSIDQQIYLAMKADKII